MAARWNTRQFALGLDVLQTYEDAARADPGMNETWKAVLAGREGAIRRLLGPYCILVVERGWSEERYEAWLGDLFVTQLLHHTVR